MIKNKISKSEINSAFQEATNCFFSGKYGRAEELCLAILDTDPKFILAYLQLAELSRIYEDPDEAREYCEKAFLHEPKHPGVLSLLGKLAADEGDYEEAKKHLKKAVEISPKTASLRYNLGHCCFVANDFEEAMEHFEATIKIDPNDYNSYNNMANISRYNGNHLKALEYFKKAFSINPNAPKSAYNVASLSLMTGNFDDAETFARKALETNPHDGNAYLCLSDVKKLNEQDVEAIKSLLNDNNTQGTDKAAMSFAIGKFYDGAKDYDNAFKYFKDGNQLRLKHESYVTYEQKPILDEIASEKGFFFNKEFFETRKDFGHQSTQPIFVLGMMRSGTSLVEQIISNHNTVTGAGELDYILNFAFNMNKDNPEKDRYPTCLEDMENEEFLEMAETYLKETKQRCPDAKHIIDKLPNNFFFVGLIKLLFPNAKVINIRRHPLDTCLSIYFQNFAVAHYNAFDFKNIADLYKKYIFMIKKWHEILPGFVYDICYEELTENPEEEIKKLLEFCELEWQDECLNFHKNKRAVATASMVQVRQPMYKTSQKRWMKYDKHIKSLKKDLKKEIALYEGKPLEQGILDKILR